MSLDIVSTLRKVPIRAAIYGADGVGKSTFCSGAPKSVFIATEDGLSNIDARQVTPPKSWPEIIEAVDSLASDDRCGTIVIDSLDWAESMLWSHIVATKLDEKGRKVKDIEGYGYGKGYVAAVGEWRILLAALERAGKRGKHVLLTAHAKLATVKNPYGEDYEQMQVKLQDGKNASAAALIREWVHIVAFAQLDIATVTDKDDGNRTKGMFTGRRILRTHPGAGYQGKTRLTMPEKIPLDWRAFEEAIKAGRPPSVDTLAARLSAAIGDDSSLLTRSQIFLDSRGRTSAAYLDAIANVQRIIEDKSKENT